MSDLPISDVEQTSQNAKLTAPTLDHVWLAAALALIALRPLLTAVQPHDFWWHLAMGREILARGGVPAVDSYSYTRAGEPFYDQSWLAQLLMYGLHQLGGVELLVIVQALVILLAYGLLLRLCVLRSGRLRLSVALLLASLPVVFDNWNIRPQSYALPLFAAVLTIVTEGRLGRPQRLWLLPLLLALWANVHGTFVLGLGLIGITWLGEVFKRLGPRIQKAEPPDVAELKTQNSTLKTLFFWGVLSGLATLLNPGGLAIIGYVRGLLGSSAVTSLVTEWAPPTVRDTGGLLFFLFLIGTAAVLIYARRRPDLTDMLLCGAFLWLALGASRSIIWFGMVALPLLAVQAATLLPPPGQPAPGAPVLNRALIGMLALLLVLGLPWVKPLLLPPPAGALLAPETPVAATEALRALPERPQRLFHAMSYGSYLIWAAPEQGVFIDPRIELYPFQQWRDYLNLSQANNVAELQRSYGFDGMLLSTNEQRALIDALRRDPAWQQRYEDEQSVLFTK
ncbi:MAG TPA: hypothetical protein VFS21_08145 [Roseiflexaceae bacterium]|nr:hypothetical protein [Roseiflexaceae bacterium]